MDNDTPTNGTTDAPAVADTAPALVEQAAVQVNEVAPEAAQEVKEPVAQATDTAEEKLYAGKYKSVEDMEKAYQELNSKFTSTTQEKAELSRILSDAFATPEPQAPVPADDYFADESSQPAADDGVKRDLAVVKFAMAHQDADGNAMMEILKSDPVISNINGYEARLEYAYQKSQNMSHAKAIAEAQKKGAETAQTKFVEKQAAQVETVRRQAEPADDNSELTPSQLRDTMRDDKAFDELIQKRFPGISKMRSR